MREVQITENCRKNLKKIPTRVRNRFWVQLENLSPNFPFDNLGVDIKKLRKPLSGFRMRIGDYRFHFFLDKNTIYFDAVKHRSSAY